MGHCLEDLHWQISESLVTCQCGFEKAGTLGGSVDCVSFDPSLQVLPSVVRPKRNLHLSGWKNGLCFSKVALA